MTRRPSPRTRILVATTVLPALAVVAAVAFWPRPAMDAAAPISSAHHAAPAPRLPTSTAGPVGGPPPGSVPLAAPPDSPVGGDPGTSLAEAAGSGSGAPTRDGAEALGAPREAVDPAQVVAAPGMLGGCLAEYGEDGQCLSVVPPSLAEHADAMRAAGLDPATMPHPWTCAELRTFFADGIALREPGIDPLQLDSDGDAIACGVGD